MFINSFLEKYGNIQNYKEDLLNPYDLPLNQTIYNKEEFHELRLPKIEEKPKGGTGELMKHQKIISRYLSSNTIYNSLLLVHEPGTGKSCSSIGTVEKILAEKSNIKGALFLVKGPNLINNLVNELLFVCTDGRYIPENYDSLTDLEKTHRINKKIRDQYQFKTFETFATDLSKSSDNWIINNYSNLVIVIDEVHNLRIQPGEDEEVQKQTYTQFHRFLHLVENCKILLMSGTPMKDRPDEIATIMNLILPENRQLPTGSEFVDEYLEDEGDETYIVKPDKIKDLKRHLRGRVSYLRSVTDDNIIKNFVGEVIPPLQFFKVDVDKMSLFQSAVYAEAYQKDKDDEGIYLNSRFASLFVYPDGSYGNAGFKKYIKETKIKDKKYSNYSMSDDLIKELSGGSIEDKLEKLKKFSSKYHKTIKEILDAKDKSAFVYCEYVEGSGLILLAKILEQFGFSNSKGTENTEKLRYAIITNRTTSSTAIKNILKKFNAPENKNGKIIKVILGSKVIGEGFTLKNVQQIHILTPHWNYSETDQAIARGYRLFSHKDLGQRVVVDVHQHVSLNDKNIPSIDLKMYKTSEDKDISIKRIERIIKEVSFDCSLNVERNLKRGLDDTRECEYTDCDYKCDDVDEQDYSRDLLTYNLFYSNDKIDNIINELKDLFNKKSFYTFEELKESFVGITNFQLLSALSKCINEKIRLINPYGFYAYLSEDNNQYFLNEGMNYLTAFTDVFYNNEVVLKDRIFELGVDKLYYDTIPNTIDEMIKIRDNKKREELLRKLPLSIQEILLEYAVLADQLESKKGVEFRKWLLGFFKEFIIPLDGVILSTFLFKKEEILRCLSLDSDLASLEWKDCSEEEEAKFKKLSEKEQEDLEGNPYGYYALIEKSTDKFFIRDVSKKENIEQKDNRKITKGKVCKTWDREDLVRVANAIELQYDDEKLKEMSISELKKLLDIPKFGKVAKKAYTIKELDKMKKDELARILYFSSVKKDKITCPALRKWFEDNDLVKYV